MNKTYENTHFEIAHDNCAECVELLRDAEKAYRPSAVDEATTFSTTHWGRVWFAD